jgi:hypothetical protein
MRFLSNTRALTLAAVALLACSSDPINHGPGNGNNGNGGGGGGGGGSAGGGGGGGGGGGSAGGGGGGGGGNNCGTQNFMLMKGGSPDLLIIQDRSGSMDMDASGGGSKPSKWTSMTMALNQVVSSVTTVDWGLQLFPDPAALDTCAVAAMPQVPVAANNAMSIATTLAKPASQPGGGTPTSDAIDAGVAYLQGLTDGHTHYIVLATDGEPSCFSSPSLSVKAVKNAVAAGIKTVVIGIGSDVSSSQTLSDMADAGGMPNTTAGQKSYYEVTTTADLVNALNKIATQVVSCSFALQQVPNNPDLVEIQGNGMTIPRDKTHMNGWDYGPGNMSINFYGTACDGLQKGTITNVAAVYGCPPIP